MLSHADNELLCRVGPGTPMGNLMREFWLPCLMTSELPDPDGEPQRVMLLGEKLIAFRDSSGTVGLVAENCPHRGASLFFGRNEEEGLRCVYHGWKFNAAGACVDMPNEPPESNFKHKVRLTAYPCVERGGVIWAYMGPRQTPPPLPNLEPNMLPEGQFRVQKVFRECNWAQALEGDIDTSHLGFLHMGSLKAEEQEPGSFTYYTVKERAPRYNVMDTAYGTMYAAYRPAEEDSYYYRFAQFLFPCFTMIPTGVLGVQVLARAWVPMDDEHMMFWSFAAPKTLAFGPGGGAASGVSQTDPPSGFNYLPQTSDWFGKWRLTQHLRNDFLIDREVQRRNVGPNGYTGIAGVHEQDQALTEAMGPILDRTKERLATGDSMVIRTRRRLINAAKALRDTGEVPHAVDHPEVYEQRSGGIVLKRHENWLTATEHLRKAFATHEELLPYR
jgi:phenylpropionate dioxygenase-like ring-hydroxylating dioxygenase large terminal subunit